jgi:outer membrane protein assembly factor BamA
MIKRSRVGLLLIMFCLGCLFPAEDRGTTTEAQGTETLTKKCKNRLIFSPLVFYTPETRLAFGGAGSYIFRIAGCKENARPSSVSPIVIYTLEKQFKAQLSTKLYFKNNNYRLESEIKFEKFPNKFFGIGGQTLASAEESYTSRGINLQVVVVKKLVRGFNIGLGYRFMDWDIVKVEGDGQLIRGDIVGSGGGRISGWSLLLERDTRDNIFFPLQGDLFKFEAWYYPEFLGSDFEFTTFTLDLRKYFRLFSSHVLAVQSLMIIQGGTVPFLHLAQLGGQYTMRGYFEGRFRDKNLLAFQAEYRLPLFGRFGFVGFAGFGNVAAKFNRLDLGELKSSYGFGFRYLFSKSEKIQVRFDFGFGEGSSGFYASIFEAF